MLRPFFGKIDNGLSVLAHRRSPSVSDLKEDQQDTATVVPDDVMEGNFVVVPNKGEQIKRFIVELHYLTDPEFLGLLERAKEEYSFKQKGALVIPCHPQELQKILDEPREESALVCRMQMYM